MDTPVDELLDHGGMSRSRDLDARLVDLLALMGARTPDDLHRALVFGPLGAYEGEVSMPLSYFRNAHADVAARAIETAMLLVTDPRWRVASGPLIQAIDATGIVPSAELDLLAESFVRADAKVYWKCPAHWFSTSEIHTSESAERVGSSDAEPEPRQTVAARVVSPALRRWGSARVVRLNPLAWADVYARSTELGGEAGGALLRGLLDSIDALPAKAGTLVRTEALKSGRSDVRHAALQQIAAVDWSLAQTIGRRDTNERVRRWALGLKGPTEPQDPKTSATGTTSTSDKAAPKTSSTTQVSLFD